MLGPGMLSDLKHAFLTWFLWPVVTTALKVNPLLRAISTSRVLVPGDGEYAGCQILGSWVQKGPRNRTMSWAGLHVGPDSNFSCQVTLSRALTFARP